MPTERQIEAAAQAIREVFGNRSGRGAPWSALPAKVKEDYRAEARAAIEAYERVRGTKHDAR